MMAHEAAGGNLEVNSLSLHSPASSSLELVDERMRCQCFNVAALHDKLTTSQ